MEVEKPMLPNYSFVLSLERNFNDAYSHHWMINHWHHSFYLAGMYLLTIFSLQAYMKSRPRFDLRPALAIWNILLALFSSWGFYRMNSQMMHVLTEFGFTHSVCISSFVSDNISGVWMCLFSFSKVLEFGDTLFIVLRKQKLAFLHWYHHITVLIFTWYGHSRYVAPCRWFIFMNFFAHALMYSYYAMRSLDLKMPRIVALFITICQLAQMVMGCFVCCYAYYVKSKGEPCQWPDEAALAGVLMYLSYFALFAYYFKSAYIDPVNRVKKSA